MSESISRLIIGKEDLHLKLPVQFISIMNTVHRLLKYDSDTYYNKKLLKIVPLDTMRKNLITDTKFPGICHDIARFVAVVAQEQGYKSYGVFYVWRKDAWLGHSCSIIEDPASSCFLYTDVFRYESGDVILFRDTTVEDILQTLLWDEIQRRIKRVAKEYQDQNEKGINTHIATNNILNFIRKRIKDTDNTYPRVWCYDPLDPEIDKKYKDWESWAYDLNTTNRDYVKLQSKPPVFKVPPLRFSLFSHFRV